MLDYSPKFEWKEEWLDEMKAFGPSAIEDGKVKYGCGKKFYDHMVVASLGHETAAGPGSCRSGADSGGYPSRKTDTCDGVTRRLVSCALSSLKGCVIR